MVRGRRQEIGLGSPPVVTPAKAREAALANKRVVHEEGEPLAAKHAAEATYSAISGTPVMVHGGG